MQRKESIAVLDRATFIIKFSIMTYLLSLVASVVAVVCSLFVVTTPFVVGMSWLLRVFSLFFFTVEGHVYLSKVGVAREVIKRKFVDCFRRRKDAGPGAWAQVAAEEMDLETSTTM